MSHEKGKSTLDVRLFSHRAGPSREVHVDGGEGSLRKWWGGVRGRAEEGGMSAVGRGGGGGGKAGGGGGGGGKAGGGEEGNPCLAGISLHS